MMYFVAFIDLCFMTLTFWLFYESFNSSRNPASDGAGAAGYAFIGVLAGLVTMTLLGYMMKIYS